MQISGGGDDAVKFGSDWSVGKRLDSYNVTVVNSVVGCGCNGLQFGSETLGDFHDYHFGKPAPSFRPLPPGSTADRLAVSREYHDHSGRQGRYRDRLDGRRIDPRHLLPKHHDAAHDDPGTDFFRNERLQVLCSKGSF